MTMEFSVVIEKDEDGYYVASASGLHGCHTHPTSIDVLMPRNKEAIELSLELSSRYPVTSSSGCNASR